MSEKTKIICPNCGAVSDIAPLEEGEEKDWLECSLPKGFEWSLPAGKISPVVGEPIYISATGEQLTWDQYIEKYNIDPEIAYQRMRARSGHEIREGFKRGKSQ
jgi:hypothetical protein